MNFVEAVVTAGNYGLQTGYQKAARYKKEAHAHKTYAFDMDSRLHINTFIAEYADEKWLDEILLVVDVLDNGGDKVCREESQDPTSQRVHYEGGYSVSQARHIKLLR